MRIVTAANERYFGQIDGYLRSLAQYCQYPATVVCIGDRHHPLSPIETVKLPRACNAGAPIETESPQHGSFLQVVEGPDDETLIFTDGDIIMQRPFSDAERAAFDGLDDDTVLAGYNSGPDETLEIEARRLFPRFGLDVIAARFGDLSRPCYNIGVFAAKRRTYRRIYETYMTRWQLATDAFGHAARQQWLVIHTIHVLGLQVQVTPYSLHANGHYGMPPGCHYRDGVLYHGLEVVCLRHKL